MQHRADWQTLYDRKLDWAYEARNNLVNDCTHHDIFFFEDHANQSEMMISVYGKSQRGKTTCILSLMGIKEDHVKTVTDLLRGSRKKGKSATSTATVYTRAHTDFFSLEYIDNCYIDISDEMFVEKIDEVRERIEKSPGSIDQITIHLPRKYFTQEEHSFGYKIVDLPGVESAEEKERDHVRVIVDKYLKSSDSVLIVELANGLTDLGNTSFARQGIGIWSKRFKVILTRSFSLESIKSLVLGKNEEEMYLNLKRYYEEEVQRSLMGKMESNLEIYPMEFGESLIEFTTAYPECRNAVYAVLDRFKRELLKSVSEALTIEDKILESVNMTNTITKRVENQKNKKENFLRGIDKKIRKREEQISESYGLKDAMNFEREMCNELLEFKKLLNEPKKSYTSTLKYEFSILDFYDKNNKQLVFNIQNNKVEPNVARDKVNVEKLKDNINEFVNDSNRKIWEDSMDELLEHLRINKDVKKAHESLIKDSFEKYQSKNTLKEDVTKLIEVFFSRKLLRQYLNADSLGLYENFLKDEYAKFSNQMRYMVESLKKEFIPIIEKSMKEHNQMALDYEMELHLKEKKIRKLKEERIEKVLEYDHLIERYENDAKVVSKFINYLTEAFTKEYNNTVARINEKAEPVLHLAYAKLIMEKYRYFTNKMENKYGKAIS